VKNSCWTITWLLLTVGFVFCECKNAAEIAHVERSGVLSADSIQQTPAKIDEGSDAILEQFKAKDAELTAKKEALEQMAREQTAREEELAQIQAELKNYRNVSYIIFLVGIILILAGLIATMRGRKSSATESAPPAP